MKTSFRRLGLVVCLVAVIAAPVFAQTVAAQLTGLVVDKSGGVVAGASVVVKNVATGVETTVITNANGVYAFPPLDPGVYGLTISRASFRTSVYSSLRLTQGTPAYLRTVLEVGDVAEVVNVIAETSLIRAQSPTVSATITHEFLNSVPRPDRSVLSFMIFLPGVETAGGAQNSRASTISGLPQNTINILIDGVSTENNLQTFDGFFSFVIPRLDAIEEVTLTTAAPSADSSAQGSTTVRFATRSGTNIFNGTAYEYFKHAKLNSNTFTNRELNRLPKPRATVNQYGASLGGPILVPGVFDGRNRAFFFFNQEESWEPSQLAATRSVLKDAAIEGAFTYNFVTPTTVNVLQLAASKGQLSTVDPTIGLLLAEIRSAVKTTGTVTTSPTNLTIDSYKWLIDVRDVSHSPTGSIDVNLSQRHHLKGTYYWQRYASDPDILNSGEPTFPGFPARAGQHSYRTTGSATLRSAFSAGIVNEVIAGWQWSPVDIFGDMTPEMFANQGGYNLSLPLFVNSGASFGLNFPETRNTVNFNVGENLSWLKGTHYVKVGGDWTRISNWIDERTPVPWIDLGFDSTNDPASSLFSTVNFPGATANDLSAAAALYALLTGRVSAIHGTAALNTAGTEYIYNGPYLRKEALDEFGLYLQDSWRWKPNVTVSLGLRYELQLPMRETIGSASMTDVASACGPSGPGNGPFGRFCNLYQPGRITNPAIVPTYVPYDANSPGYKTDYNNLGPTIGIAWRPAVRHGFGRMLLGDPERATMSAGFSRSFNRERIDQFMRVYEGNPGQTISASRDTFGGFPLVPAGESWPLLLSQSSRLGPPAFDRTPAFPITVSLESGTGLWLFDPNIKVPYTDSWTVGLQRSLGKDMAVEARYVGNRNKEPWVSEDWNAPNFRENGLLDEFMLAQTNLRANVLAGRGGTFAYMGPGTGTSPLPIFLAAFTASADSANQALYTSSQFTNTTWTSRLDPYSDTIQSLASSLRNANNGLWRTNLIAAGYPANFFVLNPLVSTVNVTRNLGGSKYKSFQLELRRRFAQGLQIQASYTYARGASLAPPQSSSWNDMHFDVRERRSTVIPHTIKLLWVYDIPFGRGRHYGAAFNKLVDSVIGGWQFSGAGRVQQPLLRLTNTKIVGMSFEEAQAALHHIRLVKNPTTGAITIFAMPQDIVDNTALAFNTDPKTTTGYANNNVPTGRYFAPAIGPDCFGLFPEDCAPDLLFHDRWFCEFDFKLAKRFPLGYKKAVFEFDAEVFNAFAATNFSQSQLVPGLHIPNTLAFRISGQQSGPRVGQLVWRVSW